MVKLVIRNSYIFSEKEVTASTKSGRHGNNSLPSSLTSFCCTDNSLATFFKKSFADHFGGLIVLAATVILLATGGTAMAGSMNKYNTIKPGVIRVAIEPYMPYTAMNGNKLIGLDSDILKAAAHKLGLKIETKVTDFPGMLASVQSQRVDISIGGIAWTASRQKVGLFTDPPYYSPPAIGVHGNATYPTIASLEGKTLGTVTGYIWAPSIRDIPGAKARTYPNANGVFEDLSAGRLDAGFLDPLLIVYEQTKRPDLDIKIGYLKPPTAQQVKEHPTYKNFEPYMTAFYLPKQEPKLEKAISKQLDAMYKNGELAKLISKWGGSPKAFLTPSRGMSAQRRGVDRPQSWNAPSIAN